MVKKIVFLFLAWRVFLFLPLIVSHFFLAPRIGFEYTLLPYFLGIREVILSNFLIYPFGNFDSVYYLLIGSQGYTVNSGFFPLFPLSIYIASFIFGIHVQFTLAQFIVASILVSVFFLTSIIFLYKLIKLDYKENIALSSIFFTLIFPTSFFYASIYSESLFLLLSLISFYFARQKNWFLASLAGGLMSATRIVGIAILPILLYEYFKTEKIKLKPKTLSFLLVPLGLGGYMAYNFFKWGNPLLFVNAQGNFQNNRSTESIVFLPQTIYRYIKILLTVSPSIYEWWIALLELSVFVFVSITLFVAWKKKVRMSYILFGILLILIPSLTGTFSGLPRYALVAFPVFITLALIKNIRFKIIYSLISIALLFILFMLFSKGYFIA